jgi:hypothetical protein
MGLTVELVMGRVKLCKAPSSIWVYKNKSSSNHQVEHSPVVQQKVWHAVKSRVIIVSHEHSKG